VAGPGGMGDPDAMFEPRFVEHGGRRILRLDYTDLGQAELRAAFDRAAAVITAEPRGSLRILTILRSRFNEESAEALKRYARGNRPYVKASAVIGTSFWKVVVASLKIAERKDLVLFEDEAAALDWLARQ